MPRKSKVKKIITISKQKFLLEIYLALEGQGDVCWEIFPLSYSASLYAFSNKKRLNKVIETKHIYEAKP
tara:strand:+ start:554 stop:760 length:207 start_codon:yes stop_codon:yes gene_type:complete